MNQYSSEYMKDHIIWTAEQDRKTRLTVAVIHTSLRSYEIMDWKNTSLNVIQTYLFEAIISCYAYVAYIKSCDDQSC